MIGFELPDPLLGPIGLFVAGTQTPWALARSRAIGALTAIPRALAHGALARSVARVALPFVFRHDALYSTAFDGGEAWQWGSACVRSLIVPDYARVATL